MKKPISLALALILLAGTLLLPACKDKTGDTTDTPGSTAPITTDKGGEPMDPTIDSTAALYDLRVDDLYNPVGIDDTDPAFSWKTNSNALGWRQTAYQIIVKQKDTTVWDSGKVESAESVGIPYAGKALESAGEYSWQVTVWNQEGKSRTSETASFEMGLLGPNAFKDAAWISAPEASLGEDTVYTIDFDFKIVKDNQGFCFGMKDSSSFVMWQINTYDAPGKVMLRPHFKAGGNWTAYPGGPGNVQAVDVTAAFGTGSIVGKTFHQRIEVNGKVVKTYFGVDAEHLTLANTYTHSAVIPLYNIGFRHNSDGNTAKEIACYDNILVRNGAGQILYENDFSDPSDLTFEGAAHISLEDGAVKVGTESATGEFIFVRTNGGGLPAFRKTFSVKENLVSAKLYTSGLGVYESFVNGERVGRKLADGGVEYHELKPGFTEMEDRKFYSTYDITWLLKKGSANTLSAMVSGSWWSDGAARHFGKNDAYLAKLVLTYADGSSEIITTGSDWKTAKASPVLSADIFSGESYDARISTLWMKPDFDDSGWETVVLNKEFRGELSAWSGSYITVRKDLTLPVKSVNIYKDVTGATANAYGKVVVLRDCKNEAFLLNPGETALIDFGQNFAGWEAFTVEGEAGTILSVRHGEILNDGNGAKSRGCDGPEGSIYNANYRSAAAATRYILAGGGKESYHPSFSFYGFRYIEITADKPVTIHKVEGQVVTSVEKDTGFMTTSDKDVNQLISNTRWGMYSNYLSVPTDCPQRDERQGWTADTQVFAKAGNYLAFSKSFLEKFLLDLRDSQDNLGRYPGTAPTGAYNGGDWGGTGWGDAGIIVPYTLYTMYGDKTVIYESWKSMQRYVDGFLASTGKRGPRNVWGDWLAYESNDGQIQDMLAVAFYAWDALMMSEMAKAIGLEADAARYLALYEEEKAYFQEKYVRPTGQLVRGEQSVCLYALYLDLLPNKESVEKVTLQLTGNIKRNGNRLQTGFLGTAILLHTLTKIDRSDLAYTLLLQHNNPSWLYSVDQGATTIWERWNSYTIEKGFGDVGMNSFNHYAYGAVAGWMFECMAGIGFDKDTPGFRRVILAPQPDNRADVTERLAVEASYDSAYGTIKAASSYEGNVWHYAFTLPANTTAEVRIPTADSSACRVNGKALSELTLETDGIALVSADNGLVILEAVAGSFSLTAPLAD